MRKPAQGVLNIIKFNWHFYAVALAAIFGLFAISCGFPIYIQPYVYFVCGLSFTIMTISLAVSYYIYDLSDLYEFNWIDLPPLEKNLAIVNITAGFDESSEILKSKFKGSKFTTMDFYDPAKHTEISIKRARRAYPPNPQAISVKTNKLPLSNASSDLVFMIFSAHEIRDADERNQFFKEVHRILAKNGEVIIVEHLRDIRNFLAYNIGFFHFQSEAAWLNTFNASNLHITKTMRHTPFIKIFTLNKT